MDISGVRLRVNRKRSNYCNLIIRICVGNGICHGELSVKFALKVEKGLLQNSYALVASLVTIYNKRLLIIQNHFFATVRAVVFIHVHSYQQFMRVLCYYSNLILYFQLHN